MIEQGIVYVDKKMDAVLTYAIPYSWSLSELFKGKGIILEDDQYTQLLKNKANVPHHEAI